MSENGIRRASVFSATSRGLAEHALAGHYIKSKKA